VGTGATGVDGSLGDLRCRLSVQDGARVRAAPGGEEEVTDSPFHGQSVLSFGGR
jgi:hypothetical protein